MRATLLSSSALLLSATAWAQNAPVSYELSFPNAVHHEAEIAATFREIGEGPLTVRMSRASPGRYALHEFAKNVYGLSAVDAAGEPLAVSQEGPYSWTVADHDGAVTVSYTLYADRADGTYSQIDLTHAHLNMPATLIWAEGMADRPVEISFEPASADWQAATQLVPAGAAMQFTAPDLQYLMDSPTELSDFDLREWTIGEGENAQTIRLAIHHAGRKTPTPMPRWQRRWLMSRSPFSERCRASIMAPTPSSPIICPTSAATAWSTATPP